MLCLPDVLNSSILDVFQNDPYPGRLCFKMILIRLCFKMILIRCFKMIRVPMVSMHIHDDMMCFFNPTDLFKCSQHCVLMKSRSAGLTGSNFGEQA